MWISQVASRLCNYDPLSKRGRWALLLLKFRDKIKLHTLKTGQLCIASIFCFLSQ